MFRNIKPDSVWSGRTYLANLGVQSCLDRTLICPVWLSPKYIPQVKKYSVEKIILLFRWLNKLF